MMIICLIGSIMSKKKSQSQLWASFTVGDICLITNKNDALLNSKLLSKQFPDISFAVECETGLLPFLNVRRFTEEK